MANNEQNENAVSHSQAKRMERKKEVASARRRSRIYAIMGYAAIAVVVALIAWGIAVIVGKEMDKVVASSDYSEGLDDNGYISGIKAADKVTLPEYKSVSVPRSEIEYTDENIDSDIKTYLDSHQELSEDESLKVADGDTIDLGYVGTIDGVEFEGGSSDSYKLTIGSGSFIDGFEEQLIGAQNGSEVTVNVTFPEDYAGSEEVAGKDAVFTCTINGIYVTPEFTDEYVAANLSDKASTVDEYRQYLKDTHERDNLEAWVETYLKDNTVVKSYPRKYVKILKQLKMYDDMQAFDYMNQMYKSYYGSIAYNTFEDYIGTSLEEYYQTLKTTAKDTCKENMAYQAIVELEGATADAEYYKTYLEGEGLGDSYYDSQVATSGEPFTLQQAIKAKAIEIVADSAVIQ